MTEAEWLHCSDPQTMLGFLQDKASDRKLRLFACACCRRVWHLLTDERSRKAITVAELFADGQVGDEDMNAIRNRYRDASTLTGFVFAEVAEIVKVNAHHAASGAAWQSRQLTFFRGKVGGTGADLTADDCIRCDAEERAVQSNILRDIVGNQFNNVAIESSWLTWNDCRVAMLAQAIYEERALPAGTLDNARLAVLADSLEDASCTDEAILAHLRSPGPHVRGCWPVDLILGKK